MNAEWQAIIETLREAAQEPEKVSVWQYLRALVIVILVYTIAILAILLLGALITSCWAMDEPRLDKADPRIGYFDYKPNGLYHIWTSPNGQISIEFPDGEIPKAVDGADMCCDDRHQHGIQPVKEIYGSMQPLIIRGCLQEQPIVIPTWKEGQKRFYHFAINTVPDVCDMPRPPTPGTNGQMVKSASASEGLTDAEGDHKARNGDLHIPVDALKAQPGGPLYHVVFKDPGAERARRDAAAKAAVEARDHRAAADRLKQETEWPFGNPFDGSWKYKFAYRGDQSLYPNETRENGSRTVFVMLAQRPLPEISYLLPGQHLCGKEKSGVEAGTNQMAHRGASQGDIIIVNSIHEDWCLRYGTSVAQVHEIGFNEQGSNPGTGTVSGGVKKVIKGETDDR